MAKELTQEEIVEIFTDYLNQTAQWFKFKEWLEKQGYTMEEFGFKD